MEDNSIVFEKSILKYIKKDKFYLADEENIEMVVATTLFIAMEIHAISFSGLSRLSSAGIGKRQIYRLWQPNIMTTKYDQGFKQTKVTRLFEYLGSISVLTHDDLKYKKN